MAAVLLFVYGSLKRQGRHHAELGSARFLGEAETAPGYAIIQLGEYPALVPAVGAGSVVGELFEVPEERLSALDEFEGEAYSRAAVEVVLRGSPGQSRMALAYLRRAR